MAIGAQAAKKLSKLYPHEEIEYCQLRTVYDKSAETLKDCASSLKTAPTLILSLGEANCGEVKIETRAFNFDQDYSNDNDGVHREGQKIEPNGPSSIGMNYPIQKLWCSLSKRDQRYTVISRNAGSFVCNNLAYHFLHDALDAPMFFVHVPKDKCAFRPEHNFQRSLDIIVALASKAIELGPQNESMPANLSEARSREASSEACENYFFKRLIKAY